MDGYSRYVLSWELSNSLGIDFCLVALEKAFQYGNPEIFNTDQGAQFTAGEFVSRLQERKIRIALAWMEKAELWIIFLLKGFGEM
ncbi:MAG: hypothetical protein OHK0053_05710 [Microscillaceae bacterium]